VIALIDSRRLITALLTEEENRHRIDFKMKQHDRDTVVLFHFEYQSHAVRTDTRLKQSPLDRLSSRLGSRCGGSRPLFQIDSRTKTTNLRGNGKFVCLIGRSTEPRLILLKLDGVLAATFFFAISFGARHVETLLGENRIGNHRDQKRSTVRTEIRTQGESS